MKRLTMSYRQSSWRLSRRTTPPPSRHYRLAAGQRAMTQWRDPQVAASKLELKALEERLRDLIDRRNARVQQLDEFNDLYFSRLGPLMQQILALRKTLAELNLRRQQAEARRREEDYRRCQRYMAQAVEVLATLTQRWRDLPADSVQAAERASI
jgi:hypothetical protein